MANGRDRTGDDPTRTEPGGSGTTSKITAESELGSDRAGDDGSDNAPKHDSAEDSPRPR